MSESLIMGVAGTAPAFSIASTTVVLITTVGILSPASLLYCGLIMFGIAFAFFHLNRLNPSAGASYAWVGDIFHPVLGFFAGWALLVASAVFMVSGTIPAAAATLTLFAPQWANTPSVVTTVAAFWLVLVSAVLVKGIKITSYTQVVMTVIEVAILLLLIVVAFIKFGAHPAHPFSWGWLSPIHFTAHSFITGALIAVFFFWGWDVTVNLNEETRGSSQTPGRSALWSMVVVLLIFMSFSIITLMVLNDQEIQAANIRVVFVVAEKLLPSPWSYIAVLAVMLSTLGTLETSILQFTRTIYVYGRDQVLHSRYARLHKKWQTPWVATAAIAFFGLMFLFLSSYFSTVGQIIMSSIDAIGFQVAFYYGLVGFACAWYYRRQACRSMLNFVIYLLWPALSACFLWFVSIYSVFTFSYVTTLVGIGGILVGTIPLILNRRHRIEVQNHAK